MKNTNKSFKGMVEENCTEKKEGHMGVRRLCCLLGQNYLGTMNQKTCGLVGSQGHWNNRTMSLWVSKGHCKSAERGSQEVAGQMLVITRWECERGQQVHTA
jgi:hypothetical protein